MGTEAIVIEDDKVAAEEEVETEEVETEPEDDDQTEEGETDIVLDQEDSQPKKTTENYGVRKRINSLNKRVSEAKGETTTANAELALEKERSNVLQMALDEARKAKPQNAKPDPADFDYGVDDEGFKKAHDKYTESRFDEIVDRKLAEKNKTSAQTVDETTRRSNLDKAQSSHYEKAYSLGVKDYDEAEDVLIGMIGEDNVNHIIANFDKSHIINYYLGKNPEKAEEIAHLLKTNAIKAVAEIGRLEAKLKVKSKSNPASSPDEELVGGSPTPKGHVFAKHAKLVKKACSGKQSDMTKLAEFRKEQRAKGIKL